MQPHRDGGLRDGIVEVVGQRVHDRVVTAHELAKLRPALGIEPDGDEAFVLLFL